MVVYYSEAYILLPWVPLPIILLYWPPLAIVEADLMLYNMHFCKLRKVDKDKNKLYLFKIFFVAIWMHISSDQIHRRKLK